MPTSNATFSPSFPPLLLVTIVIILHFEIFQYIQLEQSLQVQHKLPIGDTVKADGTPPPRTTSHKHPSSFYRFNTLPTYSLNLSSMALTDRHRSSPFSSFYDGASTPFSGDNFPSLPLPNPSIVLASYSLLIRHLKLLKVSTVKPT